MGSRALRLLSLGAPQEGSQCHSQQADYSIMSNCGCPACSVLPRMQGGPDHYAACLADSGGDEAELVAGAT